MSRPRNSQDQYSEILSIVLNHPWLSSEEIAGRLSTHRTSATVTARLRELRGLGYTVTCRRRAGSSAYEYHVSQDTQESPKESPAMLFDYNSFWESLA